VLLDTEIIELTESAASDLGIDFVPSGHLISASTSVGNTTVDSQGNHINIPQNRATAGANIDALASQGKAKILASPRIVAVDNRIAAILSGEAVPVFTTIAVPSGGGTLLQQQLQYINVGVSLEILPRISATGDVTADLFSEVSSIIDYAQNGAPRIAVRQELTAVQVQDGQSVLIGGLLQDQEITNISKIPGLGDIPLLGEFFKNRETSHQKTNLYIVITPHVLTKTAGPLTAPPPQP
jgi:general secretion pathway protein D